MKYTDKQLLDRVKSLKSFKKVPEDFWIVGVRSKADSPDKYDDKFYLYRGETFYKVTTGTTNPGLSILKGGFKDYNNQGAAVVKADEWYYDVWSPGKHRGKIKALRQAGNITIYRDGDMDSKSEEIGPSEKGNYYGINFHPATYKLAGLVRISLGNWSAGCQVCNNDTDYEYIIDIIGTQSKVSYCLLNEF